MLAQNPQDTFYMNLDRSGAPHRFRWRGQVYRVDAIERIWRSPQNRPRQQRLYRVRSGNRRFMLAYDRLSGHWAVVKSSWRTRMGLALTGLAHRIAA